MDWELIESLSGWHIGLGLGVVAFFLIRRRDPVIRLYGDSVAALAAISIIGSVISTFVTEGSPFYDANIFGFGWNALLALPAPIAMLLALRVGADEEPPKQRRIILGVGVVYLIVTVLLVPVWTGEEGSALLSPLMLSLGLAVASLMALHIVLDHSTGPGYKIIFETSMVTVILASVVHGVVILAVGADTTAAAISNTALGVGPLVVFTLILQTIGVLVLWISTAIHERREIQREHEVDAA